MVALVITIILLLILAGIAISQLTGSGLFENARLAEEKSKEAQEKEEGILADYENEIDKYIHNAREQITVDKEEYENMKKQLELLQEQLELLQEQLSVGSKVVLDKVDLREHGNDGNEATIVTITNSSDHTITYACAVSGWNQYDPDKKYTGSFTVTNGTKVDDTTFTVEAGQTATVHANLYLDEYGAWKVRGVFICHAE